MSHSDEATGLQQFSVAASRVADITVEMLTLHCEHVVDTLILCTLILIW